MQRALPWSILCSWLPERTAVAWVNVKRPRGLFHQARRTDQPTGRETPCPHLSTWFNSWLWLKIHDCVLVVAKGTLIDWSEIYSAVANCEEEDGEGDQAGAITKDFTTDGWVTLWHVPGSRWPSVNSFRSFFPLTCLCSLSVFENKPVLKKKKKGLLTSDSSNPRWPPPPSSPPFLF